LGIILPIYSQKADLPLLFDSHNYHLTISDDTTEKKSVFKKNVISYGITGGLGIGSLSWLYKVWYKPYSTGAFHFFDDSQEWLQMDKAGHFFTAFHLNRFLHQMYQDAGISSPEWVSTCITLSYLTGIEIMDGFSRGWGFSRSDFWTNAGGCTWWYFKNNISWLKNFHFKFSYITVTDEYRKRPDLLGKTLSERIIKDYNNQVYWLGFSVFSETKTAWLQCLLVSAGYGASGMLSGHQNTSNPDERIRNLYISLDINFEKIPVRSRALKKIFFYMNFIKIPFPALQINSRGIYFVPLR
jgi:hypothetical protein